MAEQYIENFVRRVIGDEAYDNSPCQAHPLELVFHEIERLRAEVEAIQQHHKFAVEQWTLEAQQTKELEEKAHDLRAELSGWDELRMTIADLDGQSESWPDHGNAPLAIAASYALLQMSNQDLRAALAEAERENEELRRRAEDVADMWQNGMRYVPERNCYEATWTAHQIEKAGREAERLKEIIDRAVKRGDAAMAREEG